MNRIFISICLMFVVASFGNIPMLNAEQNNQQRIALLVGVEKYLREKGEPHDWWDLHTEYDIKLMKRVLIDHFDFSESDIIVLENEAATKDAILEKFRTHLIQRARPGDIVVFHFSGHGQQVTDTDGDEFDGMDESLVPFDYKSQSAKDGLTTNIIDDELRRLIEELSGQMRAGPNDKVKGNITIILDACFSGTGTRGRLRARGRNWDQKLDGPRPKPNPRGIKDAASGMLEKGVASAKGYVLISASRNDQVANQEHTIIVQGNQKKSVMMGVLSNYLVHELANSTENTTYAFLRQRLQHKITPQFPDQSPQIEGDLDNILLSGTARPRSSFELVKAVEGGVLTLSEGQLNGNSVGSVYEIFHPNSDVKNKKNRIAVAEISEVFPTRSYAKLTPRYRGKLEKESLILARAVERDHSYGDNRLKLFAVNLFPSDEKQFGGVDLAVVETTEVTEDNYDLRLGRMRANDKPRLRGVLGRDAEIGDLIIERRDGQVLQVFKGDISKKILGEVRRELLGQWRWRFLSGLSNDATFSPLTIEIRVVPLDTELDGHGKIKRIIGVNERKITNTDGVPKFKNHDIVGLQIRNKSNRKLFASVLELTPDGRIRPIFPDVGQDFDTGVAPDGNWHLTPNVFRITKPYGEYLWKVIATIEPSDFRRLLHLPNRKVRGEDVVSALEAIETKGRGALAHPLAKMLAYSMLGKDAITRSERVQVPTGEWSTSQFLYSVERPN